LETVEIGIDQKALSNVEWPFDLPFYLIGKIDDDVQAVMFNYRIADVNKRSKGWISFPNPNDIGTDGYLSAPKEWRRGKEDNTKFVFLCDGLHPNIKYNFRFEVIRKVSLDPNLVIEMKNKLGSHLKTFFKSKESIKITPAELNLENESLQAIVQSYFAGKKLLLKNNTSLPFTFDAFNVAPDASVLAFKASTNLHTALNNYEQAVSDMITEFDLVRSYILSDIDEIQTGKLNFNRYSNEVLTLPFNPGLKDFKAYSLLDGIKLLRQMSLPLRPYLKDLLQGRLKIINNGFNDTDGEPDPLSILFIASLLDALGQQQLIKDSIDGVEKPRFSYFSNLMQSAAKQITQYIPDIVEARGQLEMVTNKIPDILSTIVQFEALEIEILPIVDVVSEKSPYISTEAGISYVHPFRSATHYQGVNIYFVPIDKRAPLSSFRGGNRFLKMFCIQVGVSSYFGDRPVNTLSILGKSSTLDLNLALGLRLNRIIKINAGVIPYKTNNTFELGDNYVLKNASYASIGIDVNLLKAFGDVGTLLKL
jgi:hypothetical protein